MRASYLPVLFCLTAVAPAADLRAPPIVEWTFDQPADAQTWQPNADLRDVAVSNGVWSGRAAGHDPILVLNAPLEFPASPWQVVEICLQADRDGECELFWSNTYEGRFAGFTQEKATRFAVRGDGAWRTYRLWPFWHPEHTIVRLRLDFYDGAKFQLDSIRITEHPRRATATAATFSFEGSPAGWTVTGNGNVTAEAGALHVRLDEPGAFLLAPPLEVNATEQTFFSIRMAVHQGNHATLLFATAQTHGLHRLTFPIIPDGQAHTYNVDLLNAEAWRGQVVALGLQPSDASPSLARLGSVKLAAAPQGPPQLSVSSFALERALPRAGTPVPIAARVSNTGGETATNLQCQITLPPGVKLLRALASPSNSLGWDEHATWNWEIQAAAPLHGTATVRVWADNAAAVERRAFLEFTARPDVPAARHVPEPTPVRGKTEVGVYYFPGWHHWSQWQPLQDFPERKPVLGWYREGDPAVIDWQIKWAVEHGITFFAYDWYWSKGARQLEQALHDGFFHARYRHLLKFCLLWANHNPPQSSSHEDCLAVTRFWIENYFHRPEHLQIGGKPVVIIFSTDRLTADLGSSNVKSTLAAMREACRQAGLNGLYLIACIGNAGDARRAADEGYDAVTAYNWPGLNLTAGEKRGPYAALIDGYVRNWQHILEQQSLPLLLPVCGGWDSRPWHGDNNLVRFGRTPELFQRHLLDARTLLQSKPAALVPDAILIEAWNEWGEGSYIEPHQEFGFAYLDAIRATFTDAPPPHTDVAPEDVGLGPYDLPRPADSKTSWDFHDNDDGWGATMQLAGLSAVDDCLIARTSGIDPAFFGPPLQARAQEFKNLVVRMKLESANGQSFADTAQLFWRTSRLPESEANSLRFPVIGDGQWREYQLRVAASARWRGIITRLRLDPCNQAGVRVELDSLRLVP